MTVDAMRHVAQQFARFSPAKRRAVYQKIRNEGYTVGQFPVLPRDEAQRRNCPASSAQARLWFLWQLDPASTAYHLGGALKLDGRFEIEAAREAFAQLVERHDSLRTVFAADAYGQALQVIRDVDGIEFNVVDLSDVAEGERDARERTEVDAIYGRPFDLGAGPLLRVGVLRLAPQRHVLVVMMHHIVSDGWSMQIIVDEFVTRYRALVLGEALASAPLPVQYADYALWQRSWLDAGERERQLVYWREQLGAHQPVLQLPADHARRLDGRYRVATEVATLPAEMVSTLQQMARAQGATLFMVLLAGFQLLLQRYSGLDDIRVGVPIANRHRRETEGVVGFFVNTQVLRAQIDDRMTVAALLAQVRTAALGAQDHQDLPFEQLVEALQPERSLGVSPLFQVMFNHLKDDYRALQHLPDLELQPYDMGGKQAQFELTLETSECADGTVRARFSYAQELFDPATVRRLAAHWQAIVASLPAAPERLLRDIECLSTAEVSLLGRWGDSSKRFETAEPLHRMFERQAEARPDAVALVVGDESLSYADLNRRANRLANRLISLGVSLEDRVGIALERSVEMVVSLLAVLKAGGAYVPLDPDYPAERLAYMLKDSGVALLITRSALQIQLPSAVTALELDKLDLADEPDSNPQPWVHGENLAYVIYTSGSTGKPKGAQLCHRNVTRLLAATAEWFHFGPDDVWTMFHSYAFDFSVWEIFGALCTGGKLVTVPFWISRSPRDFLALLREQRVTVLNQTPSAFGQLLALPETYEQELSLRAVIFGGEALEPERLRPWIARFGDDRTQLINMYGITETTVHVTYRRITEKDLGQERSPVGIGIPDLGLHVLDAQMHRTPIGVAGELYVAGVGLARGYLNRAALTAERFLADPFGGDGARLYRTGDLARWNADGELEYLGRIDQQVKIRGFRIELGEIEAQLLAQADVKEAVALARDGKRLLAYVAGPNLNAAALRERLAATLPDYMVPGAIVVLDALPLNANGKVDRKALPEPDRTGDREYEAPQGELEEALSAIWAEVLEVQQVGRNDNFFELGGHSLLALTLLEKIRKRGWQAPVRSLFQHPQLAAFAQSLQQNQNAREVVVPPNVIPTGCVALTPTMLTLIDLDEAQIARIEAAVPGGAANIQDIYPLAPLQEGILFHHLLQDKGDAYITMHALGFESEEGLLRFVASFNEVIARHDILRTAVLWEGLAEPVQVVLRQAQIELQWFDTDGAAQTEVAARLAAYVHAAQYRIDVRQAPMIHAIAAFDGDRWLLQLPGHHLVLDHTTLELIVAEIALIQRDQRKSLPVPVPFRRFVAQARLGVTRAEHERFFSTMLGDVDETTAPFNMMNVQGDGSGIVEARLMLDAALAARLRRQAQRHGVSAATLFHLAWALVLGRTTGRDDVVFGTVLFGRMQGGEDADRALGLFINTLPLRIRLGVQSVEQSLRQAHQALSTLLHHEHASLSLAQRCSGLPSGTPLFTSLFNYRHSQAAQDHAAAAWEGIEVLHVEERSNYPFGMSIDDLGDGFRLVAQIGDVVDAERVCGFMQAALEAIGSALEQHPQMSLCDLKILTEAEENALGTLGRCRKNYSASPPLHHLFETQALRQPAAIALVFGDDQISYSDLNGRANRLAHRLTRLGVKPEAKVGVALERSIEMIVALLAILKAGGAYVSLDPDYPADRLAYMLEDSGVALLVTQSGLQVPLQQALTVLELDQLDLADDPDSNPQVEVHGASLAYVIYTSGSTGKPKGAQLCHRNVTRLLAATAEWFQFGPADVWTMFHSYAFDFSVWEIFGALCTGGKLVVVPFWISRSPHDFLTLLREQRVTVLNQTPSAFGQLLALPETYEQELTLRAVIFGGEALEPERLRPWMARFGDDRTQLINMYGITETTVHVTYRRITENDLGQERSPVGIGIPDLGLHVLDAQMHRTPIGVAGELYVAGAGLARGYLNRAALTSERFVADPFGGGGARLYRTGDLARWNSDGELEYLGRIDQQVKIRGFRIELGEIEAQLLAQPDVKEAVVLARDGKQLVAYVAGPALDTTLLRERLAAALPDYMVPGAIVVLDALPLNTNGKVDRKALPEPERSGERAYEAPQGELEEALARIWTEVLGVQRVGRKDNFFELGGHSLAALQIQMAMQRELATKLPLRMYFENPTIAAVSLAVEAQLQTAKASEATELEQMAALLIELEN